MSDQRTPTTATVRHVWATGHPFPLTTDIDERYAEFDRWLANYEQQIRAQIATEIEGMAREVLNRDTSTSLDRDHNQGEADQLRAIAARIRKDT